MKILIVGSGGREHAIAASAVSYTHLTLPTKRIVEISVGAVSFKKKKTDYLVSGDAQHNII